MSYRKRATKKDVLSLNNKIECLENLLIEKFNAIKELLLSRPRANSVTGAVDDTNVTPAVIGARLRSVSPAVCASAPKHANSTLEVTNNSSIAASTSTTNSPPGPEATVDSNHEESTALKKLIEEKEEAHIESSKRALAKAHHDFAMFYYKEKRYTEALDKYTLEATILKNLGLRMELGSCNRLIAHVYREMDEFENALKYVDRNLAVAKDLQNLLEEQLGMNTRGSILLKQGKSTESAAEADVLMNAALETFNKGLCLNEKRRGKLNKQEAETMVKLYKNTVHVQENLGLIDKCLNNIQEAKIMCEENKLYNHLYDFYINENLVYCKKKKQYDKALECINKALEVAGRLMDKKIDTCKPLYIKAAILCKMSDYKGAKQVLHKAWKLKTPDEDRRNDIECNLKAVAAICYSKNRLKSHDSSDYNGIKILYEKLADGARYVENCLDANDYYRKMLRHAVLAGERGEMLIPIYVSLYRTHREIEEFFESLLYHEKEIELVKKKPKEAVVALHWYAETLFLAKRPYEQVEEACRLARNAAIACKNRKDEIIVVEALLKYQKEYNEIKKMADTKLELEVMRYGASDDLDNSEIKAAEAHYTEQTVGNCIVLDDLTDTEEEEDETDNQNRACQKWREKIIRKNNRQDTQLHVACFLGKKDLLKQLIGKGRLVNTRNSEGWLPIHEACKHGHIEIVDELINSGADVNDRGGAHCNGITPMHNAASNGHLEIIQILLDSGANPSLKTDIGETPLQVLEKWRAGTNLDRDAEIIYNDICNKIHTYIDYNHSAAIINTSISKKHIEAENCFIPPSMSVLIQQIKSENDSDSDKDLSQRGRSQAVKPCDESNSDKCDKTLATVDKSDMNEYRNTSLTIKNELNEVDDYYCFDDNSGSKNNKRKRQVSDSLNVVAKKPTCKGNSKANLHK